MNIPRVLREQVKAYEKAGFHVVDVEPRNGAHFMLRFAEFDVPQIVTKNACDPRSIRNNIAQYRRLLKGIQ
jgi:pyrroloquinoline quinone (PQQ) biosynthesis protein C